MRISLTWYSLLAFVALLFVMAEAHELVHTGLGRLLCGCWGTRDFNVWSLCDACDNSPLTQLAATYAGPIFSFAMMWWGYALLSPGNSLARQSLGFALVFANLPFARILGAVFMGGNDEVYALRQLMPYHTAWALGATLVLLAVVPPLVRAYAALQPKARFWVFLGFFLLPTALLFVVILGALNSLLATGFLSNYGVLGSPVLVTCWTVLVGAAFAFSYRGLFTLAQPTSAAVKAVA
jgi:hypothetical protein